MPFHHMSFRSHTCALLLVLLAVSLAVISAQSLTVEEIVAKHLNAKGGVEKLRAVTTVKLTGRIKGQAGEAPVTSWAKRPNMMRRENTFEGQTIVSAFDGKTVWGINPMMGPKPQEITGPQADMTRQDGGDFDSPLLDYESKGHTVELVGTEPVQGVTMHHLRLTKKNGRIQDYYLNTDTYLEARMVTELEMAGRKGIISTELSNYKQVDGVMVPFHIRQTYNGKLVAEVVYDQVQFNVPVDDAFFRMPGK